MKLAKFASLYDSIIEEKDLALFEQEIDVPFFTKELKSYELSNFSKFLVLSEIEKESELRTI